MTDRTPYIAAPKVISSILASRPERRAESPPYVIVIYDHELFTAARAALGAELVPDWLYADRPGRRIFVPPGAPHIALMHTEIGAPLIAFLLEMLAGCGLQEIVIVTSAGGIASDLQVGSLFVVEAADSENGVTRAFAPGRREFRPSALVTANLHEACRVSGVRAKPARSHSSDVFFRDTPLPPHTDGGPDLVEMEAATVFAVAERRGVRAGAVGYVSDVLAEEWSRPDDHYYPPERMRLLDVIRAYVAALPVDAAGVTL
ncbi:hypothetical protein [Microbispora amethystogenes]|uniref:Nucleoside phosphorylase domain-containing protein n=1 Tax=Microbispora amethystogenes TaxID=1427754 RepID=A0ABQ4FPI2_9ACTN|nr:hypothetical protein [Microbispora amethystogenes]GIH36710.1 hypothetical protein Mam01_68740 [Microbispora amethystogenes]